MKICLIYNVLKLDSAMLIAICEIYNWYILQVIHVSYKYP
jgi:hypothetical protein